MLIKNKEPSPLDNLPEDFNFIAPTIRMIDIPSSRWGVNGKQLFPDTTLGLRNIYLIAAQQYLEYYTSQQEV